MVENVPTAINEEEALGEVSGGCSVCDNIRRCFSQVMILLSVVFLNYVQYALAIFLGNENTAVIQDNFI